VTARETYFSDPDQPEAGIFTWDISTNRLYADGLVAEYFGLTAAETELGLPQERYLARVHPEDIAQVAEANRYAILTGEPYQLAYRVERSDGSWAEVIAFGRCFYSPGGEPSHFSGIVYPVPLGSGKDASVKAHLIAALEIAKRNDESVQTRLIFDLLVEISLQAKKEKRLLS
jgi:PAS domain-containing protein